MSNNEDSFEEIFDLMLTKAAIIADKELGEELEDPTEEVLFSQEHKKQIDKIIQKERRKVIFYKISEYSKRCACVLLAMIVIASVGVFSVKAWRVKFFEFIVNVTELNTDYSFGDTNGTSYSDDNIGLAYIPSGFQMKQNQSDSSNIFLSFEKEDLYFNIAVHNKSGNASVDTENADVESMSINGYDAIYASKDNANMLIWYDDEKSYAISGNIPKSEIIKIAENIKI